MGQDNESGRASPIGTLAEALDGSELGREASAWLRQKTRLSEAQLGSLDKSDPPLSAKQHLLDFLGRSGTLAISAGTALVVVALFMLAVATVWNAATERAVIVEALSVPQSLANRGITGQVAASELLDDMQRMQRSGVLVAGSNMEVVPPGTPVKVEISAATITLDEIFVYLRNWLGHDTFVSGELIDLGPAAAKAASSGADPTGSNYELIARVRNIACRATGGSFDQIYAQVAGCVLQTVDPLRYATFLAHHSDGPAAPCDALANFPEIFAHRNVCNAIMIFEKIGGDESGDGKDAANALADIGYLIEQRGTFSCLSGTNCLRPTLKDALDYETRALSLCASCALALGNRLEIESSLGFEHDALADNVRLVNLYWNGAASDLDPTVREHFQLAYEAMLDEDRYDFRSALVERAWLANHASFAEQKQRQLDYEADERYDHIPVAPERTSTTPERDEAIPPCFPDGVDRRDLSPVEISNVAACFADRGDYPDALSAIAPSPLDCYDCLLERGLIRLAEARDSKDGKSRNQLLQRAEWWSGKAMALAPELPGAWFDLGKEKVEAEDWNGAAFALAAAHARAPHHADILEWWGDALMEGLNDPRQAIAKYSLASAYAPQWGQLYQKWGEALAAEKKYDEAAEKYRQAGGLQLSAGERNDLAGDLQKLPQPPP